MRLNDLGCDESTWYVQRTFSKLESQVRPALEAFGFYRAVINSSLNLEDDDCWRAEVAIDLGPPVVITKLVLSIDGEGKTDQTLHDVIDDSPLKKNQVFHHGNYQTFKQKLLTTAHDDGYLQATYITSRVDVDYQQLTAHIELTLQTGPRYQFGQITFVSHGLTEKSLSHYLSFSTATPYDKQKLSKTQGALLASGYFSAVEVDKTPTETAPYQVDITFKFWPAKSRRYAFGIGYATDTGPKVSADLLARRLNPEAHKAEAKTSWSTVQQKIAGAYSIPIGDLRYDWLSFATGYEIDDTDSRDSQAFKTSITATHRRRNNMMMSYFVDYLDEDFEIGERSDRTRMLLPGVQWSRQPDQHPARPQRGRRWQASIKGADNSILSEADVLQADVRAKWIRSLNDSWRALARFEMATTATDDFDRLPTSLRFYAGGDDSVRGYDLEDLSPTDDNGDAIGGKHLLFASLELDRLIAKKWSAAIFYDAGNAFSSDNVAVEDSVGLGLRWYSPIGPIRLDVARALSQSRSPRLHIRLGPDL